MPGLSSEGAQDPHSHGAVFLLFPPGKELLATAEANRPSGAATFFLTLGSGFGPWKEAITLSFGRTVLFILDWVGAVLKAWPSYCRPDCCPPTHFEFLEGKNYFFGSYAPIRSTVPVLQRSVRTCDGSEIS